MLAWLEEGQCRLKMLAASDELAHGKIGCAKRAVRQAERGGVAMTLGLSRKIQRRVPLQTHLAADVMACPNSIEDRKLLRWICAIIDQPPGAQQDFLGFRCRIAASCDHSLAEQHDQFQHLGRALLTIGKRIV
jgi:hypothetical protein